MKKQREKQASASGKRRVVILGGGLAGLSAGWTLSKAGHSVDILERDDFIGGLAVTKQRGDMRYDLGPHNIHTVLDHILVFLRRNFADSIFEHYPKSKIIKRGKFIDYPLRGAKVLTSLPAWRLPSAGLSFLSARTNLFVRGPGSDDSFAAWIRARFGDVLYGEYFGPYAEKVWGIQADNIDRYVAEKRVPAISITELIRSTMLGRETTIDHPEFKARNYYLRQGIGEIAEFLGKGIEQSGGRIHLSAKVTAVHSERDAVRSVTFVSCDGQQTTLPADALLSTIPISAVVPLMNEVPDDVRVAARELDYCATVLVFIKVAKETVLPSSMLYFHDTKARFSRVYDVGMYSKDMVPGPYSLLCVEFPCSHGDSVWNAGAEALAAEAIAQMTNAGLFSPDQVEESFMEKIEHSYPRFRRGFQERVATCQRYFGSFSNMISFGRQGSFAYWNTDNVIAAGLRAASAVTNAHDAGFRMAEWFNAKN